MTFFVVVSNIVSQSVFESKAVLSCFIPHFAPLLANRDYENRKVLRWSQFLTPLLANLSLMP